MNNELKIIATMVVKAEFDEAMTQVFQQLVPASQGEEGNVSYLLHRDITNPLSYVMVEVWRDQAAIDAHNASAHFQAFVAAAEGKLERIEVMTIQAV